MFGGSPEKRPGISRREFGVGAAAALMGMKADESQAGIPPLNLQREAQEIAEITEKARIKEEWNAHFAFMSEEHKVFKEALTGTFTPEQVNEIQRLINSFVYLTIQKGGSALRILTDKEEKLYSFIYAHLLKKLPKDIEIPSEQKAAIKKALHALSQDADIKLLETKKND